LKEKALNLLELVGCGAVIKSCCELAHMQCPPFRSEDVLNPSRTLSTLDGSAFFRVS
jgi:hypothetical protein